MTRHLVSLALTCALGGALGALGALGACASATDPATVTRTVIDDSALDITLAKSSYGWEEASHEGVRGTIRNVSESAVYSNVGDAMLIAEEQETLYLASADGVVERQASSTSWTRVPGLPMVEGTRFVVLRPGRSYHFIAPVSGTPQTGTFRVGVTFRSTIADEEQARTGTSYSPTFTIR
jgi:hypothetical protein